MYADYWQWEQAKMGQSEAPREARILEAEGQVEAVRAEMQSPEVVSDGPRLQDCYARLPPAEEVVHTLYARWAELEAKQQ